MNREMPSEGPCVTDLIGGRNVAIGPAIESGGRSEEKAWGRGASATMAEMQITTLAFRRHSDANESAQVDQ
jgi:hypothetical protein